MHQYFSAITSWRFIALKVCLLSWLRRFGTSLPSCPREVQYNLLLKWPAAFWFFHYFYGKRVLSSNSVLGTWWVLLSQALMALTGESSAGSAGAELGMTDFAWEGYLPELSQGEENLNLDIQTLHSNWAKTQFTEWFGLSESSSWQASRLKEERTSSMLVCIGKELLVCKNHCNVLDPCHSIRSSYCRGFKEEKGKDRKGMERSKVNWGWCWRQG